MKTLIILILLFNIPLTVDSPTSAVYERLATLEPEEFLSLGYDGRDYRRSPLYGLVAYDLDGWSVRDEMDYWWTVEDIHYAAYVAQHEALILGQEGMISVVSTIHQRTISPKWCSSYYCSNSMVEEIFRPNQFSPMRDSYRRGRNRADSREAYLAVYRYILGLYDGGCIGYEFFNSFPNRPAMCRLWSGTSVMNFFSTYEFIDENKTRNIGPYRLLKDINYIRGLYANLRL